MFDILPLKSVLAPLSLILLGTVELFIVPETDLLVESGCELLVPLNTPLIYTFDSLPSYVPVTFTQTPSCISVLFCPNAHPLMYKVAFTLSPIVIGLVLDD